MSTFYDKDASKKMHKKSYRFYWFARVSWGFMGGQRRTLLNPFRVIKAWRYFNRAVEDDLKR